MPPPSAVDLRIPVDEVPVTPPYLESTQYNQTPLFKIAKVQLNDSNSNVMVPFGDTQLESIEPILIDGCPVSISGHMKVGDEYVGFARSYFTDQSTQALVLKDNFLIRLSKTSKSRSGDSGDKKNDSFSPMLDEKGNPQLFKFVTDTAATDAPMRIDLKLDDVTGVRVADMKREVPDITVMRLRNRTANVIRFGDSKVDIEFVERRQVERMAETAIKNT